MTPKEREEQQQKLDLAYGRSLAQGEEIRILQQQVEQLKKLHEGVLEQDRSNMTCLTCKYENEPNDLCDGCNDSHENWQPITHNERRCADCIHEEKTMDDEPCITCTWCYSSNPLSDMWQPKPTISKTETVEAIELFLKAKDAASVVCIVITEHKLKLKFRRI